MMDLSKKEKIMNFIPHLIIVIYLYPAILWWSGYWESKNNEFYLYSIGVSVAVEVFYVGLLVILVLLTERQKGEKLISFKKIWEVIKGLSLITRSVSLLFYIPIGSLVHWEYEIWAIVVVLSYYYVMFFWRKD